MKHLRRTVRASLLVVFCAVGVFHFGMQYLVSRPVPKAAPSAQTGIANQYYFAYGSNMPTRYLYNVRGILPAQSESGVIENYEVSFQAPGLNALEPAFAYLMSAEAKRAYGVLHRVSELDLEKVKQSEGALYEWTTLPVISGDGQVVSAQTLVRLSPGDAGTPSRRYLHLLIEGATEHQLPAAYVTELRNTPSVYVPVASELTGDAILAVVMKARTNGRQ